MVPASIEGELPASGGRISPSIGGGGVRRRRQATPRRLGRQAGHAPEPLPGTCTAPTQAPQPASTESLRLSVTGGGEPSSGVTGMGGVGWWRQAWLARRPRSRRRARPSAGQGGHPSSPACSPEEIPRSPSVTATRPCRPTSGLCPGRSGMSGAASTPSSCALCPACARPSGGTHPSTESRGRAGVSTFTASPGTSR